MNISILLQRFYLLVFLPCKQPQERTACFGPTYLQLQPQIKDHFYDIYIYLTIIPRARKGSESIAHEAE